MTSIVDARTVLLDDGTELLLAALLNPIPFDSLSASAQWPAESASIKALRALALNRNFAVSLERTQRDRYGRRIGHALHITLSKTSGKPTPKSWVQAQMVHAGHARVTLTPEISAACAKLLLTLEAEAEAGSRGLWGQATYAPKRAENLEILSRSRSTYQIVEGIVARVAVQRNAVYLNFGASWKNDFTAKLSRTTLKHGSITVKHLKTLIKHPVRIRGWIERRNGPLITIWRSEQIELLQQLAPSGEPVRHNPPRLLSELSATSKP